MAFHAAILQCGIKMHNTHLELNSHEQILGERTLILLVSPQYFVCICCTSLPPSLRIRYGASSLAFCASIYAHSPPSSNGAFLSALDPRRRKGLSGGTRNRDGKTTQRKERRSAYGDFFSLFFFLEKLGIPVSCCSFKF